MTSSKKSVGYRCAAAVAIVSCVFCLTVTTLMIANYVLITRANPLESPVLTELAEKAGKERDAALAEDVRDLDLMVRRAFFSSVAFAGTGAYLLTAGLAVFLISLQSMGMLWGVHPDPGKYIPDDEGLAEEKAKRRMAAVGGVGLAALALVLAAIYLPLPSYDDLRGNGQNDTAGRAVVYSPSVDEIESNWPSFRGPYGLGTALRPEAPLKWDAASGAGIVWKVKLARTGFSSPAVWGDRVFLTGGDKEAREIYCIDAATGDLVWTHDVGVVPGGPDKLPEVSEDTGYAAATVATDGRHVIAIFATGNMVCVDTSGSRLWARNLKIPDNIYGHASSPIIHDGMVYAVIDDSSGRTLFALNVSTGATVWENSKATEPCWSSPAIVKLGGVYQLIANGNPEVCGYRASDGNLLWSVACMTGEVAPSPAADSNLIFAANEYAIMAAIDPAAGNKVKWQTDSDLPDVSSPVAAGGFLYVANSHGMVTWYQSDTGTKLWSKEFDDGFYSSPVVIGDRLYITDMSGNTFVLAAGGKYREEGRGTVGESVVTTLAFVGSRAFIRSAGHLYCVGVK